LVHTLLEKRSCTQ